MQEQIIKTESYYFVACYIKKHQMAHKLYNVTWQYIILKQSEQTFKNVLFYKYVDALIQEQIINK